MLEKQEPSDLGKLRILLSFCDSQALNSQSTVTKDFDFDCKIKNIRMFFPSGQNGDLRISFGKMGRTILPQDFEGNSTREFFCGDGNTLSLENLNIPIRSSMQFSITTQNVDLVNAHQFFIWITMQKEAL